MKNKKFISIIWWYHKQIFSFDKEQNYHMMPLQIMKNNWYECEIFAIDSQVNIEDDPNFINWVNVKYYKNIFWYLFYLLKNRNYIIYSNSLTIKTLIVWIFWKKTIFYPHDNIFWRTWKNKLKIIMIKFFYRFFSKIRINNVDEAKEIEKISAWLGYICPLVISSKYYIWNHSRDRQWWVFIWNLTEVKNPEFLLETCKILKNKNINFNINIIWEDRYNNNWRSFSELVNIGKLNDYFSIHWYMKPEDIRNVLRKSLIYINTSIWEWQCLAVYEWALSGNVLCLPKILSFPSVFNKNALYHKSPIDLANNIENILWNNWKYIWYIKNNQKLILNNYNYSKIYQKLEKLFLNI